MSQPFEHIPHPHIVRRRQQGPILTASQHKRETHYDRAKTWIALSITVAVGSMECAALFLVLAGISAPSAFASANPLIIVSWISQTLFQLVLLPIIIVGQNIQGRASDKRAEQTYNDAEAILHELGEIGSHLQHQDSLLARILPQKEQPP